MPEDYTQESIESLPPGTSVPVQRKCWGWPRRIFTGLGLALVLLLAVAVTLLCTSGLPVDFALPYVSRQVSPPDGSWRVEMDHGLLKLNRTDGLAFILNGARIIREDGSRAFTMDAFSIYASPATLLDGNYLPRRIQIDAPQIELTRRADGRLDFIKLSKSTESEDSTPAVFPPDIPAKYLPMEGRPFELVINQPGVKIVDPVHPLTITFQDISTTLSRDKQTLHTVLNLIWLGPTRTISVKSSAAYQLDTKLVDVSFDFSPIGMDDVLPYVPVANLPIEAHGTISGTGSASVDLTTLRTNTFAFEVNTSAFDLKASRWLRNPIALQPLRLAGSGDFSTGSGKVEPLTLQAGPVKVELAEQVISQTDRLNLGGGMQLSGVSLTEVLDLLSPELRSLVPLTTEQEAGLAVESIKLDWQLATTPFSKSLPVLDSATLDGEAIVKVGTETLKHSLVITAEDKAQTIAWKSTMAPFNLAGCAVPALQGLPLEALDFPVALNTSGRIHLPDTVDELDIDFKAGPGTVKIHPLWYDYMAKPVPLKEVHLVLSAKDNLKTILIPRAVLDIDGPRGELKDFSLNLSQPPLRASELDLSMKGTISATDWLADGLWGYLPRSIQDKLGLTEDEVNELGLNESSIAFDASGHLGGKSVFALHRASTTATASLKLNTLSYPVSASADYDPQSGQWKAVVDTAALLPSSLHLSIFKRFTLPDYLITTPVSTHLETSGKTSGTIDHATLKVVVGAGEVSIPEFMSKPLPVKSVILSAKADLEKQTVEYCNVDADIDGHLAKLAINQLQLNNKQLSAQASMGLKNWDLGWVLSFWPDNLLPEKREMVKAYNPSALLKEADFSATVVNMEDPFNPDMVKALAFTAQLSDLGFAYNKLPTTVGSVTVNLDLNGAKLAIKNASVDAFGIDEAIVSTGTILGRDIAVALQSSFHGDLSRIHSLLHQLPLDPVLYENYGLDTITGNAKGKLDATFPLNLEQPVPNPAEVSATLSLKISDFQPPSLPALNAMATLGKGEVALDATVASKHGTASLIYALSSLKVDPYLDGPVDFAFSLDVPDDVHVNTAFTVDLTQARLVVAPLEAVKPPGETSRIVFRTEATGLLDEKATPAIDFGLDYTLLVSGSSQGRVEFASGFKGEYMGFQRARMNGIKLGNTEFDAAVAYLGSSGFNLAVNGDRLDLPEIMGACAPIIRQIMTELTKPEDTTATKSIPVATTTKPEPETNAVAQLMRSFQSTVNFDEVRVAKDKSLTKLESQTTFKDGEINTFSLTAIEGTNNLLKIQMGAPVLQIHPLTIIVPNISALAQLAVAPLAEMQLPDSEFTRNIEVAKKVPNNFRSGILYLDGGVNLKDPEQIFVGKLRMDNLVLMEVPCIVRGIAQRTLRPVKEQEVFKIFNIQEMHLGKTRSTVKNMRLEGPLTMNIFEADYSAVEPRIKLKGDHALVKFEVDWPMKEPFGMKHVWLENAIIRALGTNDESWSDLIDQ